MLWRRRACRLIKIRAKPALSASRDDLPGSRREGLKPRAEAGIARDAPAATSGPAHEPRLSDPPRQALRDLGRRRRRSGPGRAGPGAGGEGGADAAVAAAGAAADARGLLAAAALPGD